MSGTLTLNSEQWHQQLAMLVDKIGCDDFVLQLSAAICSITQYNHIAAYTLCSQERPVVLYHNLPEQWAKPTFPSYSEGAYLLDPIAQFCFNDAPSGVYHLKDLAPDHFKQSEYFKRYYKNIGLRDESVVLLKLKPDFYIAHSIGHRFSSLGRMSKREQQRLHYAAPTLLAICRRHWQIALQNKASDENGAKNIATAFHQFGAELLTSREQEIVREVLKGHSNKSIAQNLCISFETVKVHRKHINNKLGVSSHAQLFSRFIDYLASSLDK
ncbi:helix-turn-helix transcriptional regulator [Dasania sp. GY-MA-18]|uniref:Helix-turn-helix transcriptional regulator n=1 Tax=Dasania phycosphaerae TaxID=2950436 RepID=A0A9J6RQK8_9GAMM|nr:MULTISPECIES: helix-turn-helix transcriptional regulator [Dasania]MCR8924069.1 helix-turn-helix transcriptional regulator [Dasania sp. GY-MA-18]MCZ0866642.1 helix-turn-helix transcriptional regulator [Dasania phycosphaerae]MCZ0870227.1 helix-turn-helix transcriptional regulator [Dasania phycosphaerae]